MCDGVSNSVGKGRVGNRVGKGRVGNSVGKRVGNNMMSQCRVGNWMRHWVSCRSVRIDSLARVADLSNVAVDVVGVVVDRLDSAVGQIHRVGSLYQTCAVIAFLLAEGGLGIVVSNGIGVTVRMVAGMISRCRGVVSRFHDGWGNVSGGGHLLCRGKVCRSWVGNNQGLSRGDVRGGGLDDGLCRS